jgi:hypothetical protein
LRGTQPVGDCGEEKESSGARLARIDFSSARSISAMNADRAAKDILRPLRGLRRGKVFYPNNNSRAFPTRNTTMKSDPLFIWREHVTRGSPWRQVSKLLAIPVLAVFSLAATNSWANDLSNGDFESAALADQQNYPIATNLNKWIAFAGQYFLNPAGPTDNFAQHRQTGGGGDEKLVQFIDGSSILVNDKLALNLDYIYDEATSAQINRRARVSIIGIAAARNYVMNGGSGTDGNYATAGDFSVGAPDVLLAQEVLPYSTTWTSAVTLVAELTQTYPYIGVIVQSECFEPGETSECDTLRGTDNFTLVVDNFGPYTKHVKGTPNAAVFGTPFAITATVDDSEFGNSTIKAAEYKILEGSSEFVGPTPMNAADGSFDMPFEDVTAIRAAGLPVGQYQICVRGQDVALNWGEWSCSNFVTYSPISDNGLNIPISNECALFYTLENPGAENEITTLQYGEAVVFDTNLRVDLKLNISNSGKVNFNFNTKGNGQGTGVTSGILYNFVLNSVLRAKTDLDDFDPSNFTFNVRAKIVGQPQEIDGYGILNGAQNNAELYFKLRVRYTDGFFTVETYDYGVECVGDPWSNLMENKDLESKKPVGRGFGDEQNKYGWTGLDTGDALLVGTKSAFYDIGTYITGDGGAINGCFASNPAGYPEIYWRLVCLEVGGYGNPDIRDSNGGQLWSLSYKNKRWQLVYDGQVETVERGGNDEYVQGFRDSVMYKGKVYVAADLGAFISGVSYALNGPNTYPGVALFVSEDGTNFEVVDSCPTDAGKLCEPQTVPLPGVPTNNLSIRSLVSYDGLLYIATLNNGGGELWTYNGSVFDMVWKAPPTIPLLAELEVYDDKLFIGLSGVLETDDYPNNDYIYVCDDCENVVPAPLENLPDIDPNTLSVIKLFAGQGRLFAGTVNFENGFSFLSYDSDGDVFDVIVDGPNDGGFFDQFNIYFWSMAEIDGRLVAGTFNPVTITEIPRGTAELWYSDDGVNWFQYPMPIGWSLLGYGIRDLVTGDNGKTLYLLSATNMIAPDVVDFDNPLAAGTQVWAIRDVKINQPGGGKRGKKR